jgi:hypothetical protein
MAFVAIPAAGSMRDPFNPATDLTGAKCVSLMGSASHGVTTTPNSCSDTTRVRIPNGIRGPVASVQTRVERPDDSVCA